MRQVEAAAKAKAEAETEAIASKEKSTNKISLADFNPSESDQDAGSIATVGATSGSPETSVEFVAAKTPIESETPKAKKPRWVAVKANLKPKASNRPNMDSMTPMRAFGSVAKQAQPPAPSMAGLDFEPVAQGLKEPPRAYPTIRRPNEL